MITNASDGWSARVSGPWTLEKLAYVQKYAEIFMRAMASKRRPNMWSELVYLDFWPARVSALSVGRGENSKDHRFAR